MVEISDYRGNGESILVLEIIPGQKAIIISGFSESDRIREAMKLGVRECLLKPYTIDKIAKPLNMY